VGVLVALSALGIVAAVLLMFVGLGRLIERQDTVASRLEDLLQDAQPLAITDDKRKGRWFEPLVQGVARLVSGTWPGPTCHSRYPSSFLSNWRPLLAYSS